MRRVAAGLIAIITLGALPRFAVAQDAEVEVRAVVDSLFDAMRGGNGAAAAAIFHPDALLTTVGDQDGQPSLRMESAEGFVQAIGAPRTQVWDERISDLEVRVDGRLASAWMSYHFFIDDVFSHCGANSIQLFRGSMGWRIIQIMDTRRTADCTPAAPSQ